MERNYFYIEYLPENIDIELLAGRCISVLHEFIYDNDLSCIGVAFPRWSEGALGNVIAFVTTSPDVLRNLSNHFYFRMMEKDNIFKVSSVVSVPPDCTEVRFKRNQNIAKCFVGEKRRRLARAKRRAKERGEVFNPINKGCQRELESFHRANISSKSSGQHYILHIQKDSGELKRNDHFNQYGLATNDIYTGTVPDLSLLF